MSEGMNLRWRWLYVICLVAIAVAVSGCTSGASGKVVSAITGEPIVGAIVEVSGSTTMTGEGGVFSFDGLKRGKYQGLVRVEGYPPTRFSLDLSKGDGSTVVEIADSELTVQVNEKALEAKAIQAFMIKLDGVAATGQATLLERLAPGKHKLVVEADNHEAYEATVTLKPGKNSVTATLGLTPLETYKRFISAGKYHRYKVEYGYILPEERKLLTLKHWIELNDGTELRSITFGDVRMLASWKSGFTKKTYRDVAEIDRTIQSQVVSTKYSDYGRTYTDNFSQHWVKQGGLWFIVHAKKL